MEGISCRLPAAVVHADGILFGRVLLSLNRAKNNEKSSTTNPQDLAVDHANVFACAARSASCSCPLLTK